MNQADSLNSPTDFDFCKRLAHEVGCVVFDVDYRLSPEYKFPIPVNDCWEAFNWVATSCFTSQFDQKTNQIQRSARTKPKNSTSTSPASQ